MTETSPAPESAPPASAVGFIGLGAMGGPMAANLAAHGAAVSAFDVNPASLEAAAAAGVTAVDSAAAVAAAGDVIVTMLPDGAALRAVMADIAPAARQGALVIDCSTVDIESARAAHAVAAKHNLDSVDAPVSGGVAGATKATLTFMVGGAEAAVARATPTLRAMGARVVPCGGPGSGQAAKICNNMILGISMLGVCEAFALADSLGLDRQAFYNVASTASGQCWSLTVNCPAPGIGPPSPADNAYRPGFAAALMLKDLRLSQQAAAAGGAETPMGAAAAEQYAAMVEALGGHLDFSAALPWKTGRPPETA